MDKETQESIEEAVGIIAGSALAMGLVAAASKIVASLVVTDVEEKNLTGTKELHPTQDSTTASKADIAASEKEGKIDQKGVAAQSGEVKASNTDAAAQTGEAKAADSGASALRTKAGASDIETKALKMT